MRAFALLALLACASPALGAQSALRGESDDAPIVRTGAGPIRGVQTATGTYFKGVPYAATTEGENRFRAPQPVESWAAVRDATTFGPGCVQTHHNPDVPKLQSEDCLNLNVYAPSNLTASLPVMVFFHGGAFLEGSNQGPFSMYDGQRMQRIGDVVVVTVNYRLGALGFLTTPVLEGNFGLQDQRQALHWVRDNIARFGGNPGQVTIWGESAGAMSIGAHLVSPLSEGLFHGAIMESNPLGYRYREVPRARIVGAAFAAELGCKPRDTACMRAKPIADVVAAEKKGTPLPLNIIANAGHLLDTFLPWTPTSGTRDLPQQVDDAVDAGRFYKVPVLIGTNQNEGATFVFGGAPYLPLPAYDLAVAVLFGIRGADVLQTYKVSVVPPVNITADARWPLSTMLSDFWFRCASQRLASKYAQAGAPTFVYRYNHVATFSPVIAHFGLPDVCVTHTCHASELPIVFGNAVANSTFSAPERRMSDSVMRYWSNFAKHGSPNGYPSAPSPDANWPAFDGEHRRVLRIATPLAMEGASDSQVCVSLWDKLGYSW